MVETLAGLFDFEMDPQSGVALTRQLRDQLRRAIAAGSLASGRRLPSSRALALHLRVSRNTVCAAIEQLAMEGYLDVSRGRRPVVAPMPSAGLVAIGSDRPVSDGRSGMSQWAQRIDRSDWPFIGEGRPTPFAPCVADARAFPHAIWGDACARPPATPSRERAPRATGPGYAGPCCITSSNTAASTRMRTRSS